MSLFSIISLAFNITFVLSIKSMSNYWNHSSDWSTLSPNDLVAIQSTFHCCGLNSPANAYTLNNTSVSNPCSNPSYLLTAQTCQAPLVDTLDTFFWIALAWIILIHSQELMSLISSHYITFEAIPDEESVEKH
jgi:hypothetical protein